jgi:hypothetical protein
LPRRKELVAEYLSILLEGRELGLEIGLLWLVDSGTNSGVAAFAKLAKLVVRQI